MGGSDLNGSDLNYKEQLDYLERELKSAAGRLNEMSRLLDRSWSDPGAVLVKKVIARHIHSIEEINRNLKTRKPLTDDWYPEDWGMSDLDEETEIKVSFWDGNGMLIFRDGMTESRDQIRRIAVQCVEIEEKMQDFDDRKNMEILLKILGKTDSMETALIDSVFRIDRIYHMNENAIADYFDLAVQRVPPTKLGTSTFTHLSGHEEQMPFENSNKS